MPSRSRRLAPSLSLPLATILALLTVLAPPAGEATAGGLGLPTSRGVIGFGNLHDFTGLRLNFQDRDVKRVTGVNVTLWAPVIRMGQDEDRPEIRNGSYTGLGLGLLGAAADHMTGLHVGLLGLGAQETATGVMIGGLGVGGGRITGVAVGGLGIGGDDIDGIAVGGLGVGGDDLTGIAIGGLGVGGDDLTGIAIGGLGVGGDDLTGIMIGGIGVGGDALRGLAFGGGIRTQESRGAALAVAYQRTQRLYGVATGVYNRADHAEGLMIGVYNRARTLRGVQIGLLNHVGSGPAAARWLPLVNARF